jgi:hypothetical protein
LSATEAVDRSSLHPPHPPLHHHHHNPRSSLTTHSLTHSLGVPSTTALDHFDYPSFPFRSRAPLSLLLISSCPPPALLVLLSLSLPFPSPSPLVTMSGYVNLDPSAYGPRATRGLLAKFFHALPSPARLPVGVLTILSSGYLTYLLIRPSQKARPVHTLTPEWEAATEAYLEAQNMNPIRRYKESGY